MAPSRSWESWRGRSTATAESSPQATTRTTATRTSSALLRAAGLRVGTWTIPHLDRPNERAAVNGAAIPDQALARAFARIRLAGTQANLALSRFEIVTAAATAWFAWEEVDLTAIEVGLGGGHDAAAAAGPRARLRGARALAARLAGSCLPGGSFTRPPGFLGTLPGLSPTQDHHTIRSLSSESRFVYSRPYDEYLSRSGYPTQRGGPGAMPMPAGRGTAALP